MDENEYLKTDEKIRGNSTMTYPLGMIGGIVFIMLGFTFYWRSLFIVSIFVVAMGILMVAVGVVLLILGFAKRTGRGWMTVWLF